MPRGYSHALYLLPFDHRASFQAKLFGWRSPLTETQTREVIDAKQVVYEGFMTAVAAGVPRESAGILVDEQFGAAILRDAADRGFTRACPAEKSGQDEFQFEYGADFARHIEAVDPTFCKVLVRYNPEGDQALNREQAERLAQLSSYLAAWDRSRFMVELLVPATQAQLARINGDRDIYEQQIRPRLMVRAIAALQDAGVDPDVWKVEGLDRREDCESIVAAARAGDRDQVSCIVLGRGEDRRKVRRWLTIAARVPGFIGFAVGRTIFLEPLVAYRARKRSRAQTAGEIARRYGEFVKVFATARLSVAAPAGS